MEIQSFNRELQTANLQFYRLFNNISIFSNGKVVNFRCVYGNRSRIFKNIENPERNSKYKLPLIVIERTGITKNNDRLANLHNEIKYRVSKERLSYDLFTPVPIDISYQVTIISKYQDHIDRCIGNFIPFFNKDLFVRSEHPKFEGIEYTNQVIMDDSIDFDRADDIDSSQDDIVTATCNFTFKTYMFCGTEKSKDCNIKTVVKTFISCDPETGISSVVSSYQDTQYTGFIPSINTIQIGYYATPTLSSFQNHFDYVDTLVCSEISDSANLQDVHRDCFKWVINDIGTEFNQLSGRCYYVGDDVYELYSVPYPDLS